MFTDQIGPVLRDIVEQSRLAVSPLPDRVNAILPGVEVPWDACCDGQLTGRVVQIQPATGAGPRSSAPCGVLYWNVMLAVSILRCVSVVNDQGAAPSPTTMTAEGQQMLDDLQAIQQVLLCHPSVEAINSWVPLGAEGGCAGGEWTFLARIGVCGCE